MANNISSRSMIFFTNFGASQPCFLYHHLRFSTKRESTSFLPSNLNNNLLSNILLFLIGKILLEKKIQRFFWDKEHHQKIQKKNAPQFFVPRYCAFEQTSWDEWAIINHPPQDTPSFGAQTAQLGAGEDGRVLSIEKGQRMVHYISNPMFDSRCPWFEDSKVFLEKLIASYRPFSVILWIFLNDWIFRYI